MQYSFEEHALNVPVNQPPLASFPIVIVSRANIIYIYVTDASVTLKKGLLEPKMHLFG